MRTDLPRRGITQPLKSVSYEGGYVTFRYNNDMSTRVPIASILREVDIPQLSVDTVPDLTTLARILSSLLQTLLGSGMMEEGLEGEEYQDLDDVSGELAALGAEDW